MKEEKHLGKFEIENGVLTDVKEKPLIEKEVWGKTFLKKDVAHKIDRILTRWRDKCTRLEIMSGDVGYFELKAIIESEIGDLKQEKTKAIILDDNELSISKYQEEFGDLK